MFVTHMHAHTHTQTHTGLKQTVNLIRISIFHYNRYEMVTWAQQMKAMERVSKKTEDTTTSTERCGPRLCGVRHIG